MKALPIIIPLLAAGTFGGQGAHAQEEFIPSLSQTLTTIPFSLAAESVVLIKGVLVGNPDTLNFILDTGSSGISLDSTTASALHLVPQQSDINIRGIAGIRKAKFLYAKQLQLNDLIVDSLNFHINDYEFLSYVYGVRVDGVIGYSLLSRYILKIDYDDQEITICSQGTIKYPRGGHLLRPFIRTLPVHSAQLKDHRKIRSRFLLDIGAGLSLVLSKDFETDSSAIRKKRKRFPIEAHGVGGKLAMEMTLVKDFRLGPYRFRNVPTMVFEDEFNVTSYPYLGGIIGNQILKRFNLIVNYQRREIHVKPNTLYREPFEYSYSGMELYYIDGNITVGSIVQGSPAAVAGLKEGDIVIAIDNNANQDFTQYKKALMSAKKRVRLIIRRGEELVDVQVKLMSLL
ncbi:aspartyl protease family protein [Parapedobacter sp. 10938]|uniref:aspartyl protease family protein n=1 Tax=Parapedobacter flavus TaxID=3110225 RepID=UPI002DB88733|nr:aspartyl protease family protein [Parapedobacter sp. 10938]MEC3879958.1 aspartyl protease family protein [Parapedobacter sp. 10938]